MAQKRQENAKRRGPGKPFTAGDPRANKGGRPPVPPDVREALKAACPAAVAQLAYLSQHAESEALQLEASVVIVERVLGKVAQPLEMYGKDGGAIETRSEVKSDVQDPDRIAAVAALLGRVGALPAAIGAGGTDETPDSEAEPLHPAEPEDGRG